MTAATSSIPSGVAIARQPICDAEQAVRGYELLYRGPATGAAQAAARVVVTTFGDLGLAALVGQRPAFIDFPAELLRSVPALPFDPQAVVLELPSQTASTPELLARLRRVVDDGYVVALDGFVASPASLALAELASIVKVDVRDGGVEHLARQAESLTDAEVTLHADGIETETEFDACLALGYELVQGTFFCRPLRVSGPIQASTIAGLRTVADVARPDMTFEELEAVVEREPGLAVWLLRLVSSAVGARTPTIETVAEALVALGPGRVRQWVTLWAVADLGTPSETSAVA